MEDGNGDGTEDGFGDKDGERFRRRGWRTVTETNPVKRAENEDGERFRRRGWRRETRMEDGDVYVALGAHRVKPCNTTI